MDIKDVSLIIPSHNNLMHLKNAYESVRRFYPDVNLILIDDASTDGTKEWLNEISRKDDNVLVWFEKEQLGHTILYDKGIEAAVTPIVGILHADMYIGPNYIENLLKHLKRGRVVCATRVEPPLHPKGKEKITKDFGQDFDTLDIDGFIGYVEQRQKQSEDKTTKGMFAPWLLYKDDFEDLGGHDWGYAPFPFEDSDLFQRWILAGYELVQSWDSLVYHLTCRGHRWTEEIGKDSDDYLKHTENAKRHYIQKWGSWVENDEYGHPVIIPVYDKSFKLLSENKPLEFNLKDWFNGGDDVVVTIDPDTFTNQDFINVTYLLNKIVKKSGKVGKFKLGNVIIEINSLEEKQDRLIRVSN